MTFSWHSRSSSLGSVKSNCIDSNVMATFRSLIFELLILFNQTIGNSCSLLTNHDYYGGSLDKFLRSSLFIGPSSFYADIGCRNTAKWQRKGPEFSSILVFACQLCGLDNIFHNERIHRPFHPKRNRNFYWILLRSTFPSILSPTHSVS